MTISHDPSSAKSAPPAGGRRTDTSRWRLQDAKARFSELVRRVHSEGPQRVTVHGRDEVVVVSAEDYDRLHRGATGSALIAALQASPHRDIELTAAPVHPPVRAFDL